MNIHLMELRHKFDYGRFNESIISTAGEASPFLPALITQHDDCERAMPERLLSAEVMRLSQTMCRTPQAWVEASGLSMHLPKRGFSTENSTVKLFHAIRDLRIELKRRDPDAFVEQQNESHSGCSRSLPFTKNIA